MSELEPGAEEQYFDSYTAVGEDESENVGKTEECGDEATEDDDMDYTPLAGSDDTEAKRVYKEYKAIVKVIQCENETIERLKSQIHEINSKNVITKDDRAELKNLHENLEVEMSNLQDLTNKACKLQNFGSKRRYKDINLVTTFDEENMAPIHHTCATLQGLSSQRAPSNHSGHNGRWRASGGDTTTSEPEPCNCPNCACEDETEEQLMREIFAALQAIPSNIEEQHSCKKPKQPPKSESMEKVKQKIHRIEDSMNKLKSELCKRIEKKRDEDAKFPCPEPSPCHQYKSCIPPKTQELKKLKDNYMHLLNELGKKDEDLKELTKKLKSTCGSGSSADASEILLLTSHIDELKEEQVEFKCLMKEQSVQLEDYRNKYLSAQQKVEEQTAVIEKLNMNNKRIEKQINLEIKEIRCKFQEKLKELLQYPKLLENEQIKVAKMCKIKDELESKLVIVCKELKSLKNKAQHQNDDEGCKPQLQRCEQELEKAKKTLDEVQRQRDLFCEQLKACQEDVDCLRSESARIIARLKERSEIIKKQQQDQINRLEKQLAQCRATACLSVSDRECVIREMQGQLNTLSYSFDAAQKQIKTLRNHIAYMSNENCFPSKC